MMLAENQSNFAEEAKYRKVLLIASCTTSHKFYTPQLNFTAIVFWLLFVPDRDLPKSQPNPRWNIQEQLTVTVPSCTHPR